MANYQISGKAEADLDGIWFYTAEKWSFEQAERYIDLLRNKIEEIAEHPTHGRRYLMREGYRIIKVKSHHIYYKMLDEDTVRIVRVLHERMDAESRLSE